MRHRSVIGNEIGSHLYRVTSDAVAIGRGVSEFLVAGVPVAWRSRVLSGCVPDRHGTGGPGSITGL